MRLAILSLVFLGFAAQNARSQTMDLPSLDPTATEGRALFSKSCTICHLPPQFGAATYGPLLNQASLGGDAQIMKQVVSEGQPHMPAFKHMYSPIQIDAIVAYLKTVPVPAVGR